MQDKQSKYMMIIEDEISSVLLTISDQLGLKRMERLICLHNRWKFDLICAWFVYTIGFWTFLICYIDYHAEVIYELKFHNNVTQIWRHVVFACEL